MVRLDKLVAQTVEISSIASLPWQLIFIFVKFLIGVLRESEPIAQLILCIVDLELVVCERFADRVRFIWLVRFVNTPELAANLIANARRRQQFVISFEVDVDPI